MITYSDTFKTLYGLTFVNLTIRLDMTRVNLPLPTLGRLLNMLLQQGA